MEIDNFLIQLHQIFRGMGVCWVDCSQGVNAYELIGSPFSIGGLMAHWESIQYWLIGSPFSIGVDGSLGVHSVSGLMAQVDLPEKRWTDPKTEASRREQSVEIKTKNWTDRLLWGGGVK